MAQCEKILADIRPADRRYRHRAASSVNEGYEQSKLTQCHLSFHQQLLQQLSVE